MTVLPGDSELEFDVPIRSRKGVEDESAETRSAIMIGSSSEDDSSAPNVSCSFVWLSHQGRLG